MSVGASATAELEAHKKRAGGIMLAILLAETGGLIGMLHGTSYSRILLLFAFHPAAFGGWVLAALVAAAYAYGSARSLPYIAGNFLTLSPLKLLVIPFALASGGLEELFFRKVLMDQLAHSGCHWPVQLLISAAGFGVPHAIFGAFAGRWSAVVSPVIWTTILGGALAAVYLLAGRDVAPCAWSHAAINFMIEPWLILAVMQRRPSSAQAL